MPLTATGDQTIQIHQSESLNIAFDFVNQLAVGETLTSVLAVTVTINNIAPGSEITVGGAAISGTQVTMLVTTNGPANKPAVAALYKFECNVATNQQPKRTAKRFLEIIGKG